MRKLLKWTGFAVLAALLLGGAWLSYIVVLNPSLHMTVQKQAFWQLMDDPELLTQLGAIEGTVFDFHSGKLSDVSWDRRALDDKVKADNLAAIEAYDPAALAGQEALTRKVMAWYYNNELAYRSVAWLAPGNTPYPVNQMFGQQNGFPRFMQFGHVVINDKTAGTYVDRLNAAGVKFDQVTDTVRRQAAMGDVPPLFVFDRVIAEMEGFVSKPAKENPLYTTFVEKLGTLELEQARRDELAAAAAKAIDDTVYPAYGRLLAAMKELRPKATADAGVWKLPGGDAYYAIALRDQTTTDLTPQEVHDIGLSEVARITAEMDAILKSQGLADGSVGARMTALGEDPRYQWPDSDEGRSAILADYTRLADEMYRRLPEAFSSIPPQKLEMHRIPPYADSGGAYYNQPALDGSRPGRVFYSLRNVSETAKWTMKTLQYHEGVPGHHFQIATALNLDLPLARTQLGYTAYVEGWALYAERLAWEMGMYKDDPLGDLGRLQAEIYRAARLVVDTGIHFKRWSREQAIDYMVGVTGSPVTDITSEIERYAVMPGQACAYKIGMLKILEIREKAKAMLGAKFDIKAFHRVVLENGPLPLTILEEVVNDWVNSRQGSS
jgi:uncharacterized protein (DUF885 family)